MWLIKDDIVLDLYCGIETIGLSVAYKVKKVIGIKLVDKTVLNIMDNAYANNIKNAVFYAADAVDMQKIIDELPKDERRML